MEAACLAIVRWSMDRLSVFKGMGRGVILGQWLGMLITITHYGDNKMAYYKYLLNRRFQLMKY